MHYYVDAVENKTEFHISITLCSLCSGHPNWNGTSSTISCAVCVGETVRPGFIK